MLALTILFSTLLCFTSSAPTSSTDRSSSPGPRCQPVHGQCDGVAINFIREVADLEECRLKCDNQPACHFYSYHRRSGTGTEAHHRHCYFYTSCQSLRFTSQQSHWVSGISKYHSDCFTSPFIVAVHNLLRPT